MSDYELKVRESIKGCKSWRKSFTILVSLASPILMKDELSNEDREMLDILSKIKEEERLKWWR